MLSIPDVNRNLSVVDIRTVYVCFAFVPFSATNTPTFRLERDRTQSSNAWGIASIRSIKSAAMAAIVSANTKDAATQPAATDTFRRVRWEPSARAHLATISLKSALRTMLAPPLYVRFPFFDFDLHSSTHLVAICICILSVDVSR